MPKQQKKLIKPILIKRYLPDFTLESSLRAVSDLEQAVCDRDIILVAIPSHSFRDVLKQIAPYITAQAVVSLTKVLKLKHLAS